MVQNIKYPIQIPIRKVQFGSYPFGVDDRDMLMYCYGYYCERKKLRLYCMFKCPHREACQKSRKKLTRLMLFQLFGFSVNLIPACLAPGLNTIGNLIACLMIAGIIIFAFVQMFKETNQMLAAIDKLPISEDSKP